MEALEVSLRKGRGVGYAGRVFREIQDIIGETEGKSGAVIRVLQQAQGLLGYLPEPVIKTISRDLKFPVSEVYGIVSFYHFFTMVPKGRHVIQVCMGTSCCFRALLLRLLAMVATRSNTKAESQFKSSTYCNPSSTKKTNKRFTLLLLMMRPSYSINIISSDIPLSYDKNRFRIAQSSVLLPDCTKACFVTYP